MLEIKKFTLLILSLPFTCTCFALDHVEIKQSNGQTKTITGKTLVLGREGGQILQDKFGRLHYLTSEEVTNTKQDGTPFTPATKEEMGVQVTSELPITSRYENFVSKNYVLVYEGGRKGDVQKIASWIEKLNVNFYRLFDKTALKMQPIKLPLALVVLRDKPRYIRKLQLDTGLSAKEASETQAYYHLHSNQIVMYNSGVKANNVATLMHEATHQLASNAGLFSRLAKIPVWVTEGLAVFFETPRQSGQFVSWDGAGRFSPARYKITAEFLRQHPKDPILRLVQSDDDFNTDNAKRTEAAYGLAWAVTRFLVHKRREQYAKYLAKFSQQKPLEKRTMDQRIADFQAVFGDIGKLEKAFAVYFKQMK